LKNRYQASRGATLKIRSDSDVSGSTAEAVRLFRAIPQPRYANGARRVHVEKSTLLITGLGLVVAIGGLRLVAGSPGEACTSGCGVNSRLLLSCLWPRGSAGGACAGRGPSAVRRYNSGRHDDQTGGRWCNVGLRRGHRMTEARSRGSQAARSSRAWCAACGALWNGGALRRHAIGAGVCVGHGSFVVCGDSENRQYGEHGSG
jgi:hypothetical protein